MRGDTTGTTAQPALAGERPTPPAGLNDAEAADRRARGMGNDATISSGRGYLSILRQNAFTPLNILLMLIAAVLVALGLLGDAAVTAVLVIVNVLVGVVQETRAKRSLDRLSVLTGPTAVGRRDGVERTIEPPACICSWRVRSTCRWSSWVRRC